MRFRTLLATLALAALMSAPAAAERLTLTGGTVSIWNLAGQVILEPGAGSDVVVVVERGGRDAARLELETDRTATGSRLRVRYDADRVVYPRKGWSNSQSTVSLRADGTWGGEKGWGGRRVTVVSSGRGMEAFANLRVQVPRGRKVEVHVVSGEGQQSKVEGDILFDGGASGFSSSETRGSLNVDVGSGRVEISRHVGDLIVDTGSGDVDVSEIQGDRVSLDTGSGRVGASSVRCRDLLVDTGSGSVALDGVDAASLHVDTGSGAVAVSLLARQTDVLIDTGSGGVRLAVPDGFGADLRVSTGSGGIHSDLDMVVRERDRDTLVGRIGDGGSRVVIDTGSGGVQLRRGR